MNDKEKLSIKEWGYDLISRNGAIKALYRFCDENDTENPHIDALVDDVLGNLPEARPVMYGWWIPVTERLPEDDPAVKKHIEGEKFGFLTVLVYNGVVKETNRFFNNEPRYGLPKTNGWEWASENVTHWMPMPNPPDTEESK